MSDNLPDSTYACPPTTYVSSGYPAVDTALAGGWPFHRIVQVIGPTDISLHLALKAAAATGLAIHLVDPCGLTLDLPMAAELHIAADHLHIHRPADGIAWAALGALIAKDRDAVYIALDCSFADDQPGAGLGYAARAASKVLRSVCERLARKGDGLLFILDRVIARPTWGTSNFPTAGGNAAKYYAWVRCTLAPHREDAEEAPLGWRLTVLKNKAAAPFTSAHFDIEKAGR